jgi:hypothetical protein
VSKTFPVMPCPPVGYSVYFETLERSKAFSTTNQHGECWHSVVLHGHDAPEAEGFRQPGCRPRAPGKKP